MKELYISVDVEADGPHPIDYSMVALGAVAAGSLDTNGDIEKYDFHNNQNLRFYVEMKPATPNFKPQSLEVGSFVGIPNGTPAQQIREYLEQYGETPENGMNKFVDWCFSLRETFPGVKLVFAGYPLGFDWTFTYCYLYKYAERGEEVFGFSRHLDMKTEYASQHKTLISRSIKRNMPKALLKSQAKHTHNALDDAAGQADLLMNLLTAR